MSRILPIFKGIGRGVQILAVITILAMNLLMAYIMFAPDELPKPFYLNYKPGGVAMPFAIGGVTPTAGPVGTPTPTPDPLQEYQPGQGLMVDTGTKIINLADPGGRRYLKVTITLEVAPPPGVEVTSTVSSGTNATPVANAALTAFNDKMSGRMPVINDTLTTLLSSKTFDSIYTMDGKEQLRQEIQKTLNTRLPDLYVIAVYFTEFVVQ
jgi:flagellar basal body-associated protein FliL